MVYRVITEYFQEDPAKIGNFNAQCINLWNDYVWRNRSHVVSCLADLPDLSANRDWVKGNVTDLSSVIEEYFGKDPGTRFREVMTDLVTDMIQISDYFKRPPNNFNISTDKFVVDMFAKLRKDYTDLFDLLSNLNPGVWNSQRLKTLVDQMAEYWISQFQMRMARAWNEDMNAVDKTFDMAREIANIFADGIVKQFPEKFAMS
jgi:hypothetical protein